MFWWVLPMIYILGNKTRLAISIPRDILDRQFQSETNQGIFSMLSGSLSLLLAFVVSFVYFKQMRF